MKKIIYLVLLVLCFGLYARSQNPESGWFWSLEKNEFNLTKEGDSLKYEGMGWSETPSGKYAFKFSETSVSVYFNGFMGQSYTSAKEYSVTNRKMIGVEDDFTLYEYFAFFRNEKARFLIKVSNKEEYKSAYIFFYEDMDSDGRFKKRTIYSCVRQYK